jgi:ELWxxDGT repeat protein
VVALLLLGSQSLSANPNRVADINTIQMPVDRFLCPSSRDYVEPTPGTLLFCAQDPYHGGELWRSDGTASGTHLVLDLAPGASSGSPSYFVSANGTTYFIASIPGDLGGQLWQTDGTAAGTIRLTDLGSTGYVFGPLVWDGSQLFMFAATSQHGSELAVWNGSDLDFLEVTPGPEGSSPANVTARPGGGVFFSANSDSTGVELFTSDGTSVGTDLFWDVYPGLDSSEPHDLHVVGSNLAFVATIEGGGDELAVWRQSGPPLIFDIEPGPLSSSPEELIGVGNRLYYTAETSLEGRELWYYSAIADGNNRATDLDGGSGDGVTGSLVSVGTNVFFAGNNGITGWELWKKGLLGDASIVQDTIPDPPGTYPYLLAVVDGSIYYQGQFADGSFELYRSDGTDSGTGEWVDFNPLTIVSTTPHVVGSLGDRPIVALQNLGAEKVNDALGSVIATDTWEWLSGGVTTSSSSPTALTSDGTGGLRFTASTPTLGREPYLIDDSGFRLMEDGVPGGGSLYPSKYLVVGGRTLMLAGAGSDAPLEPYAWDGEDLTQINLLGSGDSSPTDLVQVGDLAVVRALDAGGDYVLYGIDASTLATEILTLSPVADVLIEAGDTLFFFVGGIFGGELWRTDGTSSGTALVKDTATSGVRAGISLRPGSGLDLPRIVFLCAGSGATELWYSDGTTGGTTLIGANGIGASQRVVVSEERALYTAYSVGGVTPELFLTDGSAGGPTQVTDRANGGDFVGTPLVLGSTSEGWFYRDYRPSTGSELWFTDGISTQMLELNPGTVSSLHSYWGATLDDRFIISLYTPERGSELWESDGTLAGTRPLDELVPGPEGQVVQPVASGNRVYFPAIRSLEEGRELWYWETPLFSDGFESGTTSAW